MLAVLEQNWDSCLGFGLISSLVPFYQRPARRWVEKSAREALRQVFEDWGCREVTPDETVALAAQFQGNPDAMQIMQLFRNWAQNKRRMDRAAESYGSYAQPTAVCTPC